MKNLNDGFTAQRARLALTGVAQVLFLSMTVAVSGCAFTTGHVNVAYTPDASAAKVAEAGSPKVTVTVSDKRATQAVGQKINGFGMKTADIVSDSDIPATVKTAFEQELTQRGFDLGPGGDLVAVQLSNFQSQFKIGFVSGDTIGDVGMNVAVNQPDGQKAYEKYVTGQGKDWFEIASPGNAEKVLALALKDAISKVFADPDFIAALKK